MTDFKTKRLPVDFLEKKNPQKSDLLLLADGASGDSFVVAIATILNMIKDIAQGAMGGHSHKEYARTQSDETITGRWEYSQLLHLLKGFRTSDFVPGMLGVGSAIRKEGSRWVLDIDELRVRKSMSVLELVIQKDRHQSGRLVFSAASGIIRSVEEQDDSFRCYIEQNDDLSPNEFIVGDFARCQTYSGAIRYYWSKVIRVGSDFVDLSKQECDGELYPIIGDDLCLFGSLDETRQSIIVISSVGSGAPSIQFYDGVDSFTLEGKNVAMFGKGADGKMIIQVERGSFRNVTIGGGSKFPVLEDQINNLPFVGRNLLRNTRDYAELKHWEEYRWELQAEDDHIGVVNNDWTGHEPAIELFAKSISGGALSCFQYFDTTPGKSHILSGYIAGHRSAKRILVRHQGGEVAANVVYDSMISGGEQLGNWVKINIPFVATKARAYVVLEMNLIDDTECYIWFKRLKVEIGERATEWSPAYEDTEEGIAQAKNEASEAKDKAILAQSAITDMNDDSVFDVSEKQSIRTQWERISGIANITEHHGANGSFFKALVEVSKVSSLSVYLGELNRSYDALLGNLQANGLYLDANKSGFDRKVMAAAFASYGNAEVACYNAIQGYYTGIAQSTANASTIPTVVVETSTDQVLRGDGFLPATLSAKRVLKVGDQREVLDKVNLVQNGTSISSLDHWFVNTDQPSKFALNNTDGYVKLDINQNGFGWCFLCNATKINYKKGHKYRIKVRFETQNWSFGGVHVAVADGESAFCLFESEAVFPAGNTYYEWSFTVDKDVPTDRDILLRFDMRNMSTTGVVYPFYTFQLYSAIVEEVDMVEFSGRNYLLKPTPQSWTIEGGWIIDGYRFQYTNLPAYSPIRSNLVYAKNGDKFFLSMNVISFQHGLIAEATYHKNGTQIDWLIQQPIYNVGYFELPINVNYSGDFDSIKVAVFSNQNTFGNTSISNLMLSRTSTPWQPAPEDAILMLNGAEYVPNTAIAIANDPKDNYTFAADWKGETSSKNVGVVVSQQAWEKVKGLEYLKEAYAEDTTIQGGVIQNSVTLMQDKDGNITCVINGDPERFNAVAFAAGVAAFNKDGETRNLQIFHDGRLIAKDAEIEGKVNATSGSFTGSINAASGAIGGFEIGPGRIGVDNGEGYHGLSILESLIKFSNDRSWAGIGTGVYPASSGLEGLARFDISNLDEYGGCVAMSVSVPPSIDYGWAARRAYSGIGNFSSIGGHCLYDTTYRGAAYNNTIIDNLRHTHRYVFTSIPSAHQLVTLPGHDVINSIVSNRAVSFTLEILIAIHVPNKIRITGTNTGWLVGNTGVPVNGDFGWIDMYQSNSIVLKYHGSHYFIQKYP